MRCDSPRSTSNGIMAKFQSTHLHEVRRTVARRTACLSMFQSTHLHEVRPPVISLSELSNKFQSTHLHEVRPLPCDYIHCFSCFNPRTYMRCDFELIINKLREKSFNPRTYMRCDLYKIIAQVYVLFVSIHAPT